MPFFIRDVHIFVSEKHFEYYLHRFVVRVVHSEYYLHSFGRQSGALRVLLAPFYRQSAVGTTLNEKFQRWIVLSTAIAGTFLLAAVDSRVITIKLLNRGKGITLPRHKLIQLRSATLERLILLSV